VSACPPATNAPARPGPDDRLVRALRERLSRGGRRAVALHETHLSWVLLAGKLALKIKKPLRLPFVDLSTVRARRANCDAELRLNRRLAPALYRAVLDVRGTVEAPSFAGAGPALDAVLVMRRFPDGALLSERLAAGTLEPGRIDALALRIAAFHDAAPALADVDALAAAFAPLESVLSQLAPHVAPDWSERAAAWLASSRRALAPLLRRRREQGAVRDVHGDLHLANTVALGEADATAFDCLEFDAALRRIDVMADVAFLTMDLRARGRGDLAWRFLDRYLAARGDYGGLATLRCFEAARACVRALVGALSPAGAASGTNYAGLASVLMAPRQGAPRLALLHGLAGSGKSTLAARLVEHAGAVRVRSDRERKRLAGLAPLDRAGAAQGLYGAAATDATYERLLACARDALAAGYDTLVDATFLSAPRRDAFARLARALGADFAILACEAPEDVLRARLARRAAQGADPSDADAATLALQLREADPLTAAELEHTLHVDTSREPDVAALTGRWHAARYRTPRRPSRAAAARA